MNYPTTMSKGYDFSSLKVDLLQIVERRLGNGTKKGKEYLFPCPFHSDSKPSFSVNPEKNIGGCFACGTMVSDSLDFLLKMGLTYKEAVAEIKNESITDSIPTKKQGKEKKQAIIWTQIKPEKNCIDFSHYQLGVPSDIYTYKNSDGSVYGYVLRFNTPTESNPKSKEFRQLIYAESPSGKKEWRFQGFQEPRPLYNLDLIINNLDKTVFISEGEKTANACNKLFNQNCVSTTWTNGSNSLHKTDFTPLYGRNIILSYDNDDAGLACMREVYLLLKNHCPKIKLVVWPNDTPKKYDFADWTGTIDEAVDYVRVNYIDASEMFEKPKEDEFYDFGQDFIENEPPIQTPTPIKNNYFENEFFMYLGFSPETGSNSYNFFSKKTKKIITLTASSLTTANFIQLAPLSFWELEFPGSKGGINILMAQNSLIRNSENKGTFNILNVRGRGIWIDGKDTVFHLGDKLLVNGKLNDLGSINGKFIYERNQEIEFNSELTALRNNESNLVLETAKLVNFERNIDAYLLSGWAVIAPICGALSWRPHIWITGGSGTGKSTIIDIFIKNLLGEFSLHCQGASTSEAGIRGTLQKDALPIVFDEAEGKDKKSQEKIQDVLGLMRSSSTTGSNIIKGTAQGGSKQYVLRSCFCFASIAVQLDQQADKTRVSVLSIQKNEDKKRFENLKRNCLSFSDEFRERLITRTIKNIKVLLANCKTFSAAASTELGSNRAGDQVGVLLAGAFSLTSEKEISYDDALVWIRNKDFQEEKEVGKSRDEFLLLNHILDHLVNIEVDNKKYERNIGELILVAFGEVSVSDQIYIDPEYANQRLKRIGIKYDTNLRAVLISNTSKNVKKIIEGTQWAMNHDKILLRLPGASKHENTYFTNGLSTRAVNIPINLMINK